MIRSGPQFEAKLSANYILVHSVYIIDVVVFYDEGLILILILIL